MLSLPALSADLKLDPGGFNPPGADRRNTAKANWCRAPSAAPGFFCFFLSQDSRGVKRSVLKVQPGEQRRKLSALFCYKPCITLHLSITLLRIPAALQPGNRCTRSTWKTPEDDTSHSGGGALNTSDTSGETPQRLNEHVEVKKR